MTADKTIQEDSLQSVDGHMKGLEGGDQSLFPGVSSTVDKQPLNGRWYGVDVGHSDITCEREEPWSPEMALWQAVIMQAWEDANYRNPRPSDPIRRYDPNDKERVFATIDQVAAINWLLTGGDEFDLACLFAGLDPAIVRETARRKLKDGGQI